MSRRAFFLKKKKNIASTRLDRHFSPQATSSSAPNLEQLKKKTRCFICKRVGRSGQYCPDKAGNVPAARALAPVLMTQSKCDIKGSARDLDELPREIESLSQEWSACQRPEDEKESDDTLTCFVVALSRLSMLSSTQGVVAVLFWAQTLEEHRIKMGRAVEVPCVMCGKPIVITMHGVPGEVPCLLSKTWLKEYRTITDAQAGLLKLTQSDVTTSLIECESGHYEIDLAGNKKCCGRGRTVRSSVQDDLPVTPSRVPVTCWAHKAPRVAVSHQN